MQKHSSEKTSSTPSASSQPATASSSSRMKPVHRMYVALVMHPDGKVVAERDDIWSTSLLGAVTAAIETRPEIREALDRPGEVDESVSLIIARQT